MIATPDRIAGSYQASRVGSPQKSPGTGIASGSIRILNKLGGEPSPKPEGQSPARCPSHGRLWQTRGLGPVMPVLRIARGRRSRACQNSCFRSSCHYARIIRVCKRPVLRAFASNNCSLCAARTVPCPTVYSPASSVMISHAALNQAEGGISDRFAMGDDQRRLGDDRDRQ